MNSLFAYFGKNFFTIYLKLFFSNPLERDIQEIAATSTASLFMLLKALYNSAILSG